MISELADLLPSKQVCAGWTESTYHVNSTVKEFMLIGHRQNV